MQLTQEQQAIVDAPFLRGRFAQVSAPAGSGKTHALLSLAGRRVAAGLTCVLAYQYNATGAAYNVLAGRAAAAPALRHLTFCGLANAVEQQFHTQAPCAATVCDAAAAGRFLHERWSTSGVADAMPALVGMVKYWRPAVGRTSPAPCRWFDGVLSDWTAAAAPPHHMTWRGAWLQWHAVTRLAVTSPRWAQYCAGPLAALGLMGSPADAGGPGRDEPPLDPYDFVKQWAVVALVRARCYDVFYNAKRLELAWFPERFQLSGDGARPPLADVLFIDEAQDTPGAEAQYLFQLHAAWSLELWALGDRWQQIYDHCASVNMLRQGAPGVTHHYQLTRNWRVPRAVHDALVTLVPNVPAMGLPDDAPAGTVQWLEAAQDVVADVLAGAVVLCRSNKQLLTAAANYHCDTGEAPCVQPLCASRIARAWEQWAVTKRFADEQRKRRRPVTGGAAADDDDDDDTCGFTRAIETADTRRLRNLFTTGAPSTWIQRTDKVAWVPSSPTCAPLFSTIHGYKGQGAPKVVVLPGVFAADLDITTPRGRLAYVACTRCTHTLVAVAP